MTTPKLCAFSTSYSTPQGPKVDIGRNHTLSTQRSLYEYDHKYFPKHKCKEYKLYMAISKDIFDDKAGQVDYEGNHPYYRGCSLSEPTL
jgi:hypothetical protein